MNTYIAPWTLGVYFSLDTETNSADPMKAEVASSALVKFDGGAVVAQREWLINIDGEMSEEATEVNGLTKEHLVENGTDPKETLAEILQMVTQVLNSGRPLVVFNAAYDLTVLEVQAKAYGLPTLTETVRPDAWSRVIDPMIISKGLEHFWRHEFVKGRNFKLPSVCERYGVPFTESHEATADAVGAGLVAAALVNEDPDLGSKGPEALLTLQRKWRTRMQDSLRKYFDKEGIEHDGVDAGFPLHSSLLADS